MKDTIIKVNKDGLTIEVSLKYISREDLLEFCKLKNVTTKEMKFLEGFSKLPRKERHLYKKELKRILSKFE